MACKNSYQVSYWTFPWTVEAEVSIYWFWPITRRCFCLCRNKVCVKWLMTETCIPPIQFIRTMWSSTEEKFKFWLIFWDHSVSVRQLQLLFGVVIMNPFFTSMSELRVGKWLSNIWNQILVLTVSRFSQLSHITELHFSLATKQSRKIKILQHTISGKSLYLVKACAHIFTRAPIKSVELKLWWRILQYSFCNRWKWHSWRVRELVPGMTKCITLRKAQTRISVRKTKWLWNGVDLLL